MRLRDEVGITNCEVRSTRSKVELPPPWFELQISRLPEKVVIPLDRPGPPVQ